VSARMACFAIPEPSVDFILRKSQQLFAEAQRKTSSAVFVRRQFADS
jgi:hypothetical protein